MTPIELTIANRRDLRGESPTERIYYLQPCYRSRITTEELTEQIERMTSLSEGDVYNVLITLTTLIARAIRRGDIVELDRLGTFKANFRSRGTSDPTELTTSDIKLEGVSFRPKPEMKRLLQGITYSIKQS